MRLGRLRLGTKPAIAAVITGGIDRPTLRKAKKEGADLVELRVDTFGTIHKEQLKAKVEEARSVGLPLLLTIRGSAEGGKAELHDTQRLELYEELTPLVDAVDVELGAKIAKEVVSIARRKRKKVILSFHDFRGTPEGRVLRSLVRRGRRLGAHAVKIATTVRNREELKRLAALLIEEEGLIVVGMGRKGLISRVFFPYLGSLVTYASVSERTAPGQPDLRELKRLFSML